MSPLDVLQAGLEVGLRNFRERLPLFTAGLVVFVLFVLLAWLARAAIGRALRRQDPTLARMVATLAYGGTLAFGLMAGLWVALPTFNFADIFASLGLTGLILGFALRDIIENFVAGLLILWRRPFRVGDQIVSGKYEGEVDEINFRSTVLRTYDGIKVYVPNGKVFTEPIENKTAYLDRRSTVMLGIDQNASVAEARGVILRALQEVDGVLSDPHPLVFFEAVDDFANTLHVHFWTRPPTRMSELTTRSAVTERIYEALREAGIDFPYPIQTIHLHGIGETTREK
jgi:small conductance mechanosensitive channel